MSEVAEIVGKMQKERERREQALARMPDMAMAFHRETEQLGSYLAQMGEMMIRLQNRLDELEEKQRMATLTHDEVQDVRTLIRLRAVEYCEKYDIDVPMSRRAVGGAIKRAVLKRYGVKDLHDVPAIARQAVEAQISRWADIRLAMKCREKIRDGSGDGA